ncbi:1318_t:CDS:2 [Funneliformis mosseae]|uniref:1318_t:CDS:1 n=1 Tax=Funneliformis mosseae TaxID=27381 RepID=A0A9N8VMR5_FUNMO|nr:1318_t:CDS:2 [Funneliformis mosseae]
MLTTTKPSSLVSQEKYTTSTTSASSSNSPTNGESSVNSNNNLTEFLTTTTTTPPSYSLLYCWTILCTYIATTNSSNRLKNSTKPVHQSSLTSTPSFSSMMKTKTLILDLDETLIHSTSRGSRADAHMIEVMVDNHACLYYVYKRPHVDHFLKKVVIFTASMPEYADPVIDWLDPNKNLIGNRYFRQSCTNRNGAYIKDLTIIEPDLSKVCLVDNSPISYAMHQENGIAIEGWISDPHDEALLDLLPFLDALRFTEDVRSILSLAIY